MKIVIVLLILILLTGASYVVYLNFFNGYKKPVSPQELSRPVTQEPVSLTLNLSSPDDNLLSFDADILIQGKASSGATIIISSNDTDQVIQQGTQENFSATLHLQKGVNQLTITAFDNLGNSKSETRTVYYSTEKI